MDGVFDEPAAVATTRLSVGPGGAQSDGVSINPVMTPDGRYVCFISTASVLVPGVGGGILPVYRLDRVTGELLVMSSSNGGAVPGNRDSLSPSISDDGEWVAFQSTSSNWVSFDPPPPTSQVYMRFVPHSILLRLSTETTAQPTHFIDPSVGPGGWVVLYRSPRRLRSSIYVDGIAELADTSVATTVTSTNAVPIVVERTMYWPGGFFDYYESHGSAGSTTTAARWVVAGGEDGGPANAQTFVLIANTASQPVSAQYTVLAEAGATPVPPSPVFTLPANSRTTFQITGAARFGVLVTALDPSARLVVESAVYRTLSGGPLWGAAATPWPHRCPDRACCGAARPPPLLLARAAGSSS